MKFLLASFFSAFFLNGAPAATFERVADLNPGSVGSFPSNITLYADVVLFGAYTQPTGFELWRYDGTNISLVRDINDTADDIGFGVKEGNDSLPAWLTLFDNKVFFSAFEPRRGGELWQYDGLDATRVADINPDANDTIKFIQHSSWPQELTVFNNALYFSANNSSISTNYELWKYDGTLPTMVMDIRPGGSGDSSSYPNGLTSANGDLYFMANDGSNGYELWRHNGTTTTLLDINPGGPDSSSYPRHFTAFNDKVYFQAFHPDYGFELWETDGVTFQLAADLNPGQGSSGPDLFTIFNNHLYFRASGAAENSELWKFDGSNFTMVQDINPFGNAYPKNLTVFNGVLYFAADDGVNGWELWKYDGSTASMVTDLNPWGDSFPETFVIQNGALYFVATTIETGYEIFKYDGQAVTLAADINPGGGDSFPQFLTPYQDKLLFRATHDGFNDWELWSLSTATSVNQPPSVALTSPADGSSFLAGETIAFSANATDDAGINKVEFFANTQLLAADTTQPYSISATLAAGSYSITAKATDTDGANTTSTPITITVTSPNEPPAVALTAPADQASFLAGEMITFSVDATDDNGINKVEFFAGAELLGTDTTSPYSISATLTVGSYSITARATDTKGANTTSAAITITITSPNESPSVALTAPGDGAIFTTGETITFSATATDNTGISKVEFFANTQLLGADSTQPYSISATLAAGSYSITAQATDTDGATTTSAAINITINSPSADQPVITSSQVEAGAFVIQVDATSGVEHVLEASTDLRNWTPIATNTPSGDSITFRDQTLQGHRFYRISMP